MVGLRVRVFYRVRLLAVSLGHILGPVKWWKVKLVVFYLSLAIFSGMICHYIGGQCHIFILLNLITDDCQYRTICLVKLGKRRPSSGIRAVCYP